MLIVSAFVVTSPLLVTVIIMVIIELKCLVVCLKFSWFENYVFDLSSKSLDHVNFFVLLQFNRIMECLVITKKGSRKNSSMNFHFRTLIFPSHAISGLDSHTNQSQTNKQTSLQECVSCLYNTPSMIDWPLIKPSLHLST